MENTTFPAVLVNLMNSINAEGLLRSWRLDSTLKSYSLTIEWKILSSSQGERDFRNSQVVCQTVSQESPVISKPENSRPKPAAVSADSSKDELQKCDENILGRDLKANDCTDFQRCFRSLKSDRSFEEDTAQRDRESTKAITTENEVKYETQMCVQGRSKPVANHNKTIACERNVTCKRGTFILSPEKVWSPSTSSSVEPSCDNTIAETVCCFSRQDNPGKKAVWSCGQTFTSRHLSVSHLLLHCPVSLCFRIELECNIQREIDSWHGDQKGVGKAWWHCFKKKGFPDVLLELKEEKVNRLSTLVNDFIERASSEKLKDQNGDFFMLMVGLEQLLY